MGDRGSRPQENRRQDGFALLAVILFLLAVAAIVAPFALAARSQFDAAAATLRQDRLQGLADGLLNVVASRLAAAPDGTRASPFPQRSQAFSCRVGALTIGAEIQEQHGLVDLNMASAPLLAAGLRALGLTPSAAAAHARAIIAYREPEATAEAAPATSLVQDGLKYGAFEALEELHDFPALRPVPLARLRQSFTVHSGAAGIDRSRAPRNLAAGLSPQLADTEDMAGAPGIWHIDLSVRAADATVGHAGAIVAEAEPGGLRLIERSADPATAIPPPSMPCAALFGPDIAAWLDAGT